jgi:hypothetical protein
MGSDNPELGKKSSIKFLIKTKKPVPTNQDRLSSI